MHMQASPNWLTTLVLSVLLGALTWKLAVRAGITWQHESEALDAARASAGAPDLARPLLGDEASGRVPVAESFEAETYDPPTPVRANGVGPISIEVQQALMRDGLHCRCSSAYFCTRLEHCSACTDAQKQPAPHGRCFAAATAP